MQGLRRHDQEDPEGRTVRLFLLIVAPYCRRGKYISDLLVSLVSP